MLEKAGVLETSSDPLTCPTQLHGLVELINKEQNIYNIIFHEVIRQVHTYTYVRIRICTVYVSKSNIRIYIGVQYPITYVYTYIYLHIISIFLCTYIHTNVDIVCTPYVRR